MSSLAKLRADKRVAAVSEENPGYFVYLNPGWEWSGQASYGCERLAECWKLTREADFDAARIRPGEVSFSLDWARPA